jgi:hypothetical protein
MYFIWLLKSIRKNKQKDGGCKIAVWQTMPHDRPWPNGEMVNDISSRRPSHINLHFSLLSTSGLFLSATCGRW